MSRCFKERGLKERRFYLETVTATWWVILVVQLQKGFAFRVDHSYFFIVFSVVSLEEQLCWRGDRGDCDTVCEHHYRHSLKQGERTWVLEVRYLHLNPVVLELSVALAELLTLFASPLSVKKKKKKSASSSPYLKE